METAHTSDELFTGYAPAFRSATGWRHTFRQHRPGPHGGVIRRVVFDNTEDPNRRLLIDVAEFPTAQLARDYVRAAKDGANFAIAEGPARFGASSLAFPYKQPRSLYFCRANLMLWICSCSRENVLVEPWADQMLQDLAQEPTTESRNDLVLTAERDQLDARGATRIRVSLRWDRGEWAWRKFKATGGTLSRASEGDDVIFWPTAREPKQAVTGWTFEPGRETYHGRMSL